MTPYRRVTAATIGAAAILLGACGSTVRVTSQPTPGADFSDMATWDWYPTASLGVHDARVDTSEVTTIVREAIAATLSAKGYRRDSVAPQFLVDYHGKLEQKTVELIVRPYCPGDPEPPLTHEAPYCREYEEGVLVVHVIDAHTGKLMWSCEARDEVDFTRSAAERRRHIEDAVRQILDRFPG